MIYLKTILVFVVAVFLFNGCAPQKMQVRGVIINHHLLAEKLISETLDPLRGQKPSTVVIIGPNHMGLGSAPIVTSKSLESPAEDIIDNLIITNVAHLDDYVMHEEFSVTNVLPYVREVFPDARILPLLLYPEMRGERLEAFSAKLIDVLPEDTVMVLSADFAHVPTAVDAKVADAYSRQVIEQLDEGNVTNIKIDAPTALQVLMKYVEDRGATNFVLVNNTNSAELTGRDDLPEVTSYLTGYYQRP